MKTVLRSAFAFFLAAGACQLSLAAWINYEFIPLGDLPGGIFSSAAVDISDDGKVVVGSSVSGFLGTTSTFLTNTTFLWTEETGMVPVEYPATLPSDWNTIPVAVSADGSAVTGYVGRSNSATRIPFVWTEVNGLEVLGKPASNSSQSQGHAVANAASLVVGADVHSDSVEIPLIWTPTDGFGSITLPIQYGQTRIDDLTPDGEVWVGTSEVYFPEGPGIRAFMWSETSGAQLLGDLEGGTSLHGQSVATAISNDGGVVVGYSDSYQGLEAFIWTQQTGMVGLGDLPGGDAFSSVADDISGDGSTVVGASSMGGGYRAVVWDADAGIQDLRDLLIANGVDMADYFNLNRAYGVSYDGSAIVGQASGPMGGEAFLVRRTWVVPEPASSILAMVMLGIITARSRR